MGGRQLACGVGRRAARHPDRRIDPARTAHTAAGGASRARCPAGRHPRRSAPSRRGHGEVRRRWSCGNCGGRPSATRSPPRSTVRAACSARQVGCRPAITPICPPMRVISCVSRPIWRMPTSAAVRFAGDRGGHRPSPATASVRGLLCAGPDVGVVRGLRVVSRVLRRRRRRIGCRRGACCVLLVVRAESDGGWLGVDRDGAAVPLPRYAGVAAGRLRSLSRFATAEARHSSLAAPASPRREKRRNPIWSLRCPLTGSTVAARRR